MLRNYLHDLAAAVGDDFVITIATQSEVALHHFHPFERVLPVVRPLGQQPVKPVVDDGVLAVLTICPIQTKGQTSHGFREHAHASVYGRQPHGSIGVDTLAGAGAHADRFEEEVAPNRAVFGHADGGDEHQAALSSAVFFAGGRKPTRSATNSVSAIIATPPISSPAPGLSRIPPTVSMNQPASRQALKTSVL